MLPVFSFSAIYLFFIFFLTTFSTFALMLFTDEFLVYASLLSLSQAFFFFFFFFFLTIFCEREQLAGMMQFGPAGLLIHLKGFPIVLRLPSFVVIYKTSYWRSSYRTEPINRCRFPSPCSLLPPSGGRSDTGNHRVNNKDRWKKRENIENDPSANEGEEEEEDDVWIIYCIY